MVSPAAYLLLTCALLLFGNPTVAQNSPDLASIRNQLDQGNPWDVLRELDLLIGNDTGNAEAYLLRSTAYVMIGELQTGHQDLQRALQIDPDLRQAWLNLAGLEIAERRYEAAYDALLQARRIDPNARDNGLNLGAVLLQMGRIAEADAQFNGYLTKNPQSAEAIYLVASNYAAAGQESRATDSLAAAIRLDERVRLRARGDERFLALGSTRYRELLSTDAYVMPADHHHAAAAFAVPYEQRDLRLVQAVLAVLQQQGLVYDPGIETTPRWALIWGDLRIKIFAQDGGTGVVSLSAPPDRYDAGTWDRLTQALFAGSYERLSATSR